LLSFFDLPPDGRELFERSTVFEYTLSAAAPDSMNKYIHTYSYEIHLGTKYRIEIAALFLPSAGQFFLLLAAADFSSSTYDHEYRERALVF
jgi:hypothetical protein